MAQQLQPIISQSERNAILTKLNLNQDMSGGLNNSPTDSPSPLVNLIQAGVLKVQSDANNAGIGYTGSPPYIIGPENEGGWLVDINSEIPILGTNYPVYVAPQLGVNISGPQDPNVSPVKLHSAQIACFTFINYYNACVGWPIGDLGGYIINCCGSGCTIIPGAINPGPVMNLPDSPNPSCYSKLVHSGGEVCVAKRPAGCTISAPISRSMTKTPPTPNSIKLEEPSPEDEKRSDETNYLLNMANNATYGTIITQNQIGATEIFPAALRINSQLAKLVRSSAPKNSILSGTGSPLRNVDGVDVRTYNDIATQVIIQNSNGEIVSVIERAAGEPLRLSPGISQTGNLVVTPVNPNTAQPVAPPIITGSISPSLINPSNLKNQLPKLGF